MGGDWKSNERKKMNAGNLLERIIKAMATKPEEVFVIVEESLGRVDVTIRAVPVDSRRLVGQGGQTISAISVIASALWHPKSVKVHRIESVGEDSKKWEPFTDKSENWYAGAGPVVTEMIRALVVGCYRSDPKIESTKASPSKISMKIRVGVGEMGMQKAERIASAIARVVPVISTNQGMYVDAAIEAKERHEG